MSGVSNENKKVSVVIPIYNSEKWLRECIESVTTQTLKEIEIICVNDGSTDKSESIVTEYVESDSRIILVNQENLGVSVARNTGVEAASGKYLFFLDSDDTLPQNTLDILYSKMEDRGLDIVSYNATSFSNDVELKDMVKNENNTYFSRRLDENIECSGIEFLTYLTEKTRYVATIYTIMILRSLVANNNMKFIPNIIHEDEAFVFEAYIKAENAGCINQSLYNRRRRAGSIMVQDISFINVYGTYKAFKHIEELITDSDIPEQFLNPVLSHLSRLQKSAINKYLICNEEEKEKINGIPLEERSEMEYFLIYPAHLEAELRRLRNEKKKIKREIELKNTEEMIKGLRKPFFKY